MTVDQFVAKRPRLYHCAALGMWESLRQHGLLTTACILERSGRDSEELRRALAKQRRSGNVSLPVPGIGSVTIRDQRPLHPGGLVKALPDGYDTQRWIDLLNERVFFWTKLEDSDSLIQAKACRGEGMLIELEAASLLANYRQHTQVTTFNVGYTLRKPKLRDEESFVPFEHYPPRTTGLGQGTYHQSKHRRF